MTSSGPYIPGLGYPHMKCWGHRVLDTRVSKKVLEEVLVLSLRHLQGKASNLTVHPSRNARLRRVLGIFSLDGSLGPHQGGGNRSHTQGVLATIGSGVGMLWAWPP